MRKLGNENDTSLSKSHSDIETAHRTAQLSVLIYQQLIQKGYLSSSHIPIVKKFGKVAFVLNLVKQTDILLNDPDKSILQQAVEVGTDLLASGGNPAVAITIQSVELLGKYVAPIIIDQIDAAVLQIAKTEQAILNQLPEPQRTIMESEFTLSEEMQMAVSWVRGLKWAAEKTAAVKNCISQSAQEGADVLTSVVSEAADQAEQRERQLETGDPNKDYLLMAAMADDSLSEDFRAAVGIFKFLDIVSDKIKGIGQEQVVEEIVEKNYLQPIDDGGEEQEKSAARADASDDEIEGQDFRLLTQGMKKQRAKLNPKLSISVTGGTSAGLALVGKVSMNLTSVSIGIGAAVGLLLTAVSTIFRRIEKKKYKKCQKEHEKNVKDINGMNSIYERLIQRYTDTFNIEVVDNFIGQQTELLEEITTNIQVARVKLNALNVRNKKIQNKMHRKEYKKGYRPIFDQYRAYYNTVISTLGKIQEEISTNLELIETCNDSGFEFS